MPEIKSTFVQTHVVREGPHGTEYLVLKRADNETRYPGLWQVVTGGIESGESAIDAARRELQEETGLEAQQLFAAPIVASFFDARRDVIHLVPVFAALVPRDAQPRLSEEHQEFRWLTYDQAMEILVFPSHHDGTRIVHDYILQGNHRGTFESDI